MNHQNNNKLKTKWFSSCVRSLHFPRTRSLLLSNQIQTQTLLESLSTTITCGRHPEGSVAAAPPPAMTASVQEEGLFSFSFVVGDLSLASSRVVLPFMKTSHFPRTITHSAVVFSLVEKLHSGGRQRSQVYGPRVFPLQKSEGGRTVENVQVSI